MPEETLLGKLRREYKPPVPGALANLSRLAFKAGDKTSASGNAATIEKLFPLTYGQPMLDCVEEAKATECPPVKIGVVLSGGQAAGGHNVIVGLFDALKELNPKSTLIGFLKGPGGIMKNNFKPLDAAFIDQYRNTGGFDMIAAGRDKIESAEQQAAALKTVVDNDLDGLVVIGGDDSNTNAAVLAEYFQAHGSKCVVAGVPKTIDGDLQNEYIEVSFGFDTAVKTYSEMISNICRDSLSAAKAWHFIKLMGRDASHVTVDCALQTQPNITLVGEEVQAEGLLLHDIAEKMVDIIEKRAAQGKNYGVCLIPEGIIGFIPSMKTLIADLNDMLKHGSPHLEEVEQREEMSDKIKYVRGILKQKSLTNLQNFDVLPRDIQAQLLLERDPHGNIQISQVPIEQLFILICQKKLNERPSYTAKFRAQGHFFGYDGRSGFPSNFDANYCYNLGRVASVLLAQRKNGYMCRVYNLEQPTSEWRAGGVPITMLMNMELRHGKPKPVIRKALLDVEEGAKFALLCRMRHKWALDDCYRFVGPIQFFGPAELTDAPPFNVLVKKTGALEWPVPKK